MTAAPIFTADNGYGAVLGDRTSFEHDLAVRQHLVTRALDRSVSETVASALWSIRDQLVTALAASRNQRRKTA